jgi:hypothetical protein
MIHMNSIKQVSLSLCRYDKIQKIIYLSRKHIGMPHELLIESQYTGAIHAFTAIGPGDRLYDEDGWDGEMNVYRPVVDIPNVDILIIS